MAQNEIFENLDSLSSTQKHVAIPKIENIVKTKGVLLDPPWKNGKNLGGLRYT